VGTHLSKIAIEKGNIIFDLVEIAPNGKYKRSAGLEALNYQSTDMFVVIIRSILMF